MKKKKKLKQDDNRPICYVEELRKWLNAKELREFIEINRSGTLLYPPGGIGGIGAKIRDRPKREPVEFTKCQQAICDFIEEQDNNKGFRRVAGPIKNKKALEEFLLDRNLNKSARRLRSKDPSFTEDIYAAWRLYRLTYPLPKYSLESPEGQSQPGGKTESKRKKLWGHNVSSILRFMGKEGFDYNEAKKVLDHFEVEVEDTTIRGQLWCGTQRGKYGAIAKLEEWQINELYKGLRKKE